jgi:hypothetical protein
VPVRFTFSRFALIAGVSVAIALSCLPSCAQALVGDVPGMPKMESGGGNDPGGSGGSSGGGGGSQSPGSPTPSSTPEPTTLLSGLLGLGVVGAFVAKKRVACVDLLPTC